MLAWMFINYEARRLGEPWHGAELYQVS